MAVLFGGISGLTGLEATTSSYSRTSTRWAPIAAPRTRLPANARTSSQRTQLRLISSAVTKEATQLEKKGSALDEEDLEGEEEEEDDVDDAEEDESLAPNAFEVESLLMQLCDETKIAELRIKVGGFVLHVKRDIGGKGTRSAGETPVYSEAPNVLSRPMIDGIGAPLPSAAALPPKKVEHDGEDIDEGLLYVTSPKVGIFRRGRSLKGKQGKSIVNEGSVIKVGQVTSYLEQLGTQLAVESEHAGEVVSFLVEDGDPVGFADPLMTIRPSFPGIKKLT